jgi:hypothetical protein
MVHKKTENILNYKKRVMDIKYLIYACHHGHDEWQSDQGIR